MKMMTSEVSFPTEPTRKMTMVQVKLRIGRIPKKQLMMKVVNIPTGLTRRKDSTRLIPETLRVTSHLSVYRISTWRMTSQQSHCLCSISHLEERTLSNLMKC
uniref:Uncharacterized protein n=1 Tax=Cacopsylla melanoneura TaxID=428564 RepID=A0A8D8WXG1_9HEMI